MALKWACELEAALAASTAAGACLSALAPDQHILLSAQGRDIKMQADRDAEKVILAHLSSSGFPVLAEESGAHGNVMGSEPVWVLNPSGLLTLWTGP